jgi:hypothetical protein
MTVEIGAEAALFPGKDISEIFLAVHIDDTGSHRLRVSVTGVANLVKCTVFIN